MKERRTNDGYNAGALSNLAKLWKQLVWSKVQCEVNRLQMRIAKAAKERKWNKVKALQYLLTHSFYAKLLAVKRVISNKGGRTAGIDGVTWKRPRQYSSAVFALQARGYRAQPLRRVYIPKPNGQLRPLGIPTLQDRAVQALYALALIPVAETTADKHSYGFRQLRSLHDAVEQCFKALSTRVSARWILEADIKACFDRISHDWLLENIPLPQRVLRQWLKSGYMENNLYYDTNEGTPQGGIVSPILANMTLDGLEKLVIIGRNKKRRKLNIIRYADDFIITAASREILEQEIIPDVERFLNERGLTLSEEKTQISQITNGFDFLGVNFRKHQDKLITKPSQNKSKRFLDSLGSFFAKNHGIPFSAMLLKLNSKLRGWAFAHRHLVAKRLLNRLDNEVFGKVCKWLSIEHHGKTWAWIKKRYWHYFGGRNTIGTFYPTKNEPRKWVGLFRMASVPIRRYVKIRADVNSFDPVFHKYIADRKVKRINRRLIDRKLITMSYFDKAIAC